MVALDKEINKLCQIQESLTKLYCYFCCYCKNLSRTSRAETEHFLLIRNVRAEMKVWNPGILSEAFHDLPQASRQMPLYELRTDQRPTSSPVNYSLFIIGFVAKINNRKTRFKIKHIHNSVVIVTLSH
jgi:hypothetical protein